MRIEKRSKFFFKHCVFLYQGDRYCFRLLKDKNTEVVPKNDEPV